MRLDFDLTGHNDCCPICKTHLTGLYLCPECGVRFGGWFSAVAIADSRKELLMRCKERIETDLSSRGSFHKHHYEDLLDELAKELNDDD